jgi:hypothetical protein
MRGIPRIRDSFWRNTVRYVSNVTGCTSIEVVTYRATVCHEMYARRPWPPRPIA